MEIIQLMSVIIKLSDPYVVEETELAPRKVVGYQIIPHHTSIICTM